MMSGLTTKINGEWERPSGASGIVCHHCGRIVPFAYQKLTYGERYGIANYCLCGNCFDGDKGTALTCRTVTHQ